MNEDVEALVTARNIALKNGKKTLAYLLNCLAVDIGREKKNVWDTVEED